MRPIRIVVCVKQVPCNNQVEIDEETGNLRRDGCESKMNMYDLFSVEAALSLVEKFTGDVRVITMGPPQAEAVLREAVYMGADSGTLVSDHRFAGSDVLATAYTLSQALMCIGGYDLILCGKQTTDGDTAQVGAELAELLGIPHANGVAAIEPDMAGGVTVSLNRDDYSVVQHMPLPCLLCVDGDVNTPRLPSYKRKRTLSEGFTLSNGFLSTLTLDDFADRDESHYGLAGSPTQVEAIFPPTKSGGQELFTGSGDELGKRLADLLIDMKMLVTRQPG